MIKCILEYYERHKKTTIILILYLIWSGFMFYVCHNFKTFFPRPMCGAAGAGFLMFLVGPFGCCFLVTLLFMLNSKGQNKKDFQLALMIVLIPIIIAIIDIFT